LFSSPEPFGSGEQLDMAPTAPINLKIEIIPARIRFVGPTLRVQSVNKACQEIDPIERLLVPKVERIKALVLASRTERVQSLQFCQGCARPEKAAPVARPAPDDRLQTEEQRHQWTGPET